MTRDEGVIKFKSRWLREPIPHFEKFDEINAVRDSLYEQGLLGVYADGIGFGNLSIRTSGKRFIITGTQTTKFSKLSLEHYAEILDYDIKKNNVACRGSVNASSESLTHAMIYELDSGIKAVIHVHHNEMWKKMMNQVPTTEKNVPYGTPEMAEEVRRLYRESDLAEKKILVMAGHEDGVIAFGENLEEAERLIFQYFRP